jgi:hypothetical protein
MAPDSVVTPMAPPLRCHQPASNRRRARKPLEAALQPPVDLQVEPALLQLLLQLQLRLHLEAEAVQVAACQDLLDLLVQLVLQANLDDMEITGNQENQANHQQVALKSTFPPATLARQAHQAHQDPLAPLVLQEAPVSQEIPERQEVTEKLEPPERRDHPVQLEDQVRPVIRALTLSPRPEPPVPQGK